MNLRAIAGISLSAIFLFISSALVMAQSSGSDRSTSQSESSTSEGSRLKDVFLGREDAQAQALGVVGRLGVLLIKSNGFEAVRVDHPFRSGDKFRFEITSTKNGFLYVLHASLSGKIKQLWPREETSNEIRGGQTYVIPPSPGVFVFNEEVGQELFYVAIRSDQTPPKLEDLKQQGKPSPTGKRDLNVASKAPTTNITNFRIKDPFGGTGRGVVFDPGTAGVDPYLYFSAVPGDSKTNAMIEFQLQHTD